MAVIGLFYVGSLNNMARWNKRFLFSAVIASFKSAALFQGSTLMLGQLRVCF